MRIIKSFCGLRLESIVIRIFLFLFFYPAMSWGMGHLDNEWVVGSRRFRSERLQWDVMVSSSWLAGGGFSVYDSREQPDTVLSFHPSWTRLLERERIGMTGFFYPRTQSAQSAGLLFLYEKTLGDSEEELRLSTLLGWAFSSLKGARETASPERKSLQEGAVSLKMDRTVVEDFIFDLSGSVFVYDRKIQSWSRWDSFSDQRDLAFLGGIAPVLYFPSWAWNAGFSRKLPPSIPGSLFVRYGEYQSLVPDRRIPSVTTGLGTSWSQSWDTVFSYSWCRRSSQLRDHHWSFLIRYFWGEPS